MTTTTETTIKTCDRCKRTVDNLYTLSMPMPMCFGAIIWNENHELCVDCQKELAEWVKPTFKRRCQRGLKRFFSPLFYFSICFYGGIR